MKHALVIGGSGMLAKVSLWLANQDYIVSVMGRDMNKLQQLRDQHKHIIPLSVDYNDEAACKEALQHTIVSHGKYDLVVAWIHGGEDHNQSIIRLLQDELGMATDTKWQLFHVLGSRAEAKQYAEFIRTSIDCEYHQIQLGFVIEAHSSRWLTHDEIADGVIEAIQTSTDYHLVGTLTPTSHRP